MKTSARAIAIIQCLLDGSDMVTAGTIAEKLGVSSKTVSRELPKVELLLRTYGLELLRKTGAGIQITGDPSKIDLLRQDALNTETAAYTPQQRQIILAGQLLQATEPIKLFSLASMLKVTDGTVSHDLDKLESWLKQRGLLLVRRPGLGAYVKGSERDIRRALVEILYTNLDEERLLQLFHDPEQGTHKGAGAAEQYLLKLVDKQMIHDLEQLVHEVESGLPHHLSDTAFIGLVVHLSLAIQRMRKKEDIHIDTATLAALRKRREYRMAKELARRITAQFQTEVPEDEIGYITMHLMGARSFYRKGDDEVVSVMDNFHLVRMARSIMKCAQQETGRKLLDNKELFLGLVNHLGPSISRLRMHMDIRNPLLEEMRSAYPELMELAGKAVKPMEQELGEALPEAEVAYIAMHLGAALAEPHSASRQHVRVIVACQTGMGTSRMLAAGLKQAYDTIEIVDLVSALQVNREYVQHTEADFVISTVPIPWSPLPVVVTTPLLDQRDKARIDQELVRQADCGPHHTPSVSTQKALPFLESLQRMDAYNRAIQALLHHFFGKELHAEPSIRDVCQAASRAVASDTEAQEGIVAALLRRESEGETVLRGNAMVLLHARTDLVPGPRFGILHLEQPMLYPERDGEAVRTAIVMLAPKESSCEALETIGAVSAALLERWGLIAILNEGNPHDIYQELEHIFRDFYQQKYKELFGTM
ncbi:BglG family transcription antiterminator [Mitsuokella multacida]|uniref:BglG family transcription antiterminator n=1 Tax=Mitsuokella multacida TaxID=52226 RepID=UPI000E842B0A|nr:BglG family transcription antiterminator [Mitsuokella multacida]HBQ30946.1 MtlR transcriptional regulator [Mitsuokella multacida]